MPPDRVIRHGRVEPDLWRILDAAEAAGPLPAGPIAVPLAAWRAERGRLTARREPVAVWLAPDEDPLELAADVAALPMIAVHFPKFADGRGYSIGVLLRARLGFAGELRAFGDIGRDHLQNLRRCGFDAFRLGEGRDPEAALPALADAGVHYQGAADGSTPLFRRRALG